MEIAHLNARFREMGCERAETLMGGLQIWTTDCTGPHGSNQILNMHLPILTDDSYVGIAEVSFPMGMN